MGKLLLALLLIWLICLKVSFLKTYRGVPLKELRLRARAGHKDAQALHRVAAYGPTVDLYLWLEIGIFAGVLMLLLDDMLHPVLAVLLVLVLVVFAFAWIPRSRTSQASYRLAVLIAPALGRVLGWLQPASSKLQIWLRGLRNVHVHTGLYDRDDLLELLENQKSQLDNRLSEQELLIARSALTFGDKKVGDVMTPRRVMRSVKPADPVSPHLMDELHGSGLSRFPVIEGEGGSEKVTGTLYLKDLVGHLDKGAVKDVMHRDVYYINEQSGLARALDAFIKTKHHLFVVVNNFEEIVGVVTIEDVLEQVVGKEIVDEFDQYDDLRAVATMQAEDDRRRVQHATPPQQTAEEVVE